MSQIQQTICNDISFKNTFTIVIIAGSVMYLVEGKENGFTSILSVIGHENNAVHCKFCGTKL